MWELSVDAVQCRVTVWSPGLPVRLVGAVGAELSFLRFALSAACRRCLWCAFPVCAEATPARADTATKARIAKRAARSEPATVRSIEISLSVGFRAQHRMPRVARQLRPTTSCFSAGPAELAVGLALPGQRYDKGEPIRLRRFAPREGRQALPVVPPSPDAGRQEFGLKSFRPGPKTASLQSSLLMGSLRSEEVLLPTSDVPGAVFSTGKHSPNICLVRTGPGPTKHRGNTTRRSCDQRRRVRGRIDASPHVCRGGAQVSGLGGLVGAGGQPACAAHRSVAASTAATSASPLGRSGASWHRRATPSPRRADVSAVRARSAPHPYYGRGPPALTLTQLW